MSLGRCVALVRKIGFAVAIAPLSGGPDFALAATLHRPVPAGLRSRGKIMAVTHTGKTRSSARKSPPTLSKAPAKARAATPRKKKSAATPAGGPTVTPQEWRHMVATAAYLRAEARGFIGGSADQDWLEAEAELMAKLGTAPSA
jgi:hypothetical protein